MGGTIIYPHMSLIRVVLVSQNRLALGLKRAGMVTKPMRNATSKHNITMSRKLCPQRQRTAVCKVIVKGAGAGNRKRDDYAPRVHSTSPSVRQIRSSTCGLRNR